jgi:hypothetical protein
MAQVGAEEKELARVEVPELQVTNLNRRVKRFIIISLYAVLEDLVQQAGAA